MRGGQRVQRGAEVKLELKAGLKYQVWGGAPSEAKGRQGSEALGMGGERWEGAGKTREGKARERGSRAGIRCDSIRHCQRVFKQVPTTHVCALLLPPLPPPCPQSRQEDFLQELEDDLVDEEEEGGQQEQRQDEEKGLGGDRVFGLEVIQEVGEGAYSFFSSRLFSILSTLSTHPPPVQSWIGEEERAQQEIERWELRGRTQPFALCVPVFISHCSRAVHTFHSLHPCRAGLERRSGRNRRLSAGRRSTSSLPTCPGMPFNASAASNLQQALRGQVRWEIIVGKRESGLMI